MSKARAVPGVARRIARRDTSWARFIVLTGLSGSGKSQAIRALEDLGYYCVDNLPVSLLPVMARARRAADRAQSRRRGDGHPRAALRQRFSARLSQAQDQQAPRQPADLPRSRTRGAGAALQRDAAPASARARSAGHRRPVRRARVAAADPRAWPTRSSTPRSSTSTSCGSSCASSSAAASRPRNWC